MRVVDTHTHAWGADTAELPWQAPVLPPNWEGSYTHRNLITDMNRVGVNEAVVVTTPLYGRDVRANEYTMRAIEAHPTRLYGVGLAEFYGDETVVRERLRQVVGHDRMLGVRFHAAMTYEPVPTDIDPAGDWILDDALAPVWDELAALDAAAFVFPKPRQLTAVERLANAHPDVTIIVDHLAWPDENTDPDAAPWTDFAGVADHDNVAVKVSSIPRSSAEKWPYEDMHTYLRRLLDWFGRDRLMIGSDYPWMDDWATYEQCLSWLNRVVFLSESDRQALQYRTFERLYR